MAEKKIRDLDYHEKFTYGDFEWNPEVVKVATIIREEAGDVLSDIDALELARKIVRR